MASLTFTISTEEAAEISSARAEVCAALAAAINKAPVINVGQRIQGSADFSDTLKLYLKPRS